LHAGKNLAGAFYRPTAVLCAPNVLASLPDAVYNEGMAEVIKHGMLASKDLLNDVGTTAHNRPQNIDKIIAANVTIKRDIVHRDEFDRGERQLLNFGHTVGHAVEHLSNFTIPHGHAVAIGMVVETKSAVAQGLCANECLETLCGLLEKFDLPTKTDYIAKELADVALYDKKRTGDEITVVAPREIGRCELQKISVGKLQDWMAKGL